MNMMKTINNNIHQLYQKNEIKDYQKDFEQIKNHLRELQEKLKLKNIQMDRISETNKRSNQSLFLL